MVAYDRSRERMTNVTKDFEHLRQMYRIVANVGEIL